MTLTRRDGRLPSGPGEVAFGSATMEGFGLSLGDVVEATTPDGKVVDLTVVGEAVMPPTDITAIDEGAVFTADGLTALTLGEGDQTLALRYAPGVDVAALQQDLGDRFGLEFGPYAEPAVPSGIQDVTDTRDVSLAIGAFFAVLGVLGLLHTLVISARRRRVDVAVLRTLGLRRRGVTGIMLSESVTIALTGIVVGVPLGLIVGRAVWHQLVDHLGVVAVPQQPWLVLALVVPSTLLVAVTLSWFPSHVLRRHRPARALRAE